MSRIRSWLGNMTFRFQMKRDEGRASKNTPQQDPPQNTSEPSDPLTQRVLDIMKTDKPKPKS